MTDPMRLNIYDHALIHAIGLLARASVMVDHHGRQNMAIEILRDLLPGVSRDHARIKPFADLAEIFMRVKDVDPVLAERARDLVADWDARRLGEAWDKIQGMSDAA